VNASKTTTDTPIEYDKLCLFFGWIPTATIKHTFDCMDTLVTDAYGIKSDGEFVSKLEDNIPKWGAMSKLVSDRAQSEVSNKVLDILRNYTINNWQSEPYHEHQNPAKRRYQTVNQHTNAVLVKSGAPPKAWLLDLLYAIYLLNDVVSESLGWKTPLNLLTGHTTDISIMLMFSFWEPIYFPTGDALSYAHTPGFPSDTAERMGRFVGFGESVGDALTFKILTDDTQKILYRSLISSVLSEEERRLLSGSPDRNRRAEPPGTPDFLPTPSATTINDVPTSAEIVRSPTRDKSNGTKQHMSIIAPDDLLTRTYLTEPDERGQRFRAKIVEKIVSLEEGLEQHPDRIKCLVRFEGADCLDELVAYNQVLEALESDLLDPNE